MNCSQSDATRQQRRVLSQAERTDAFGFFDLLTGPRLLDEVDALAPEHRDRWYPPTETWSMFMAQALSADGSCRQVVDDTAVKRLLAGLPPCSANTAAYCKARTRLPQTMISTLACPVGARLGADAVDGWRWRGRRVRMVDGTTATLAETKAKPGRVSPARQPTPRAGLSDDTNRRPAVPRQRWRTGCRHRPLQGQGRR